MRIARTRPRALRFAILGAGAGLLIAGCGSPSGATGGTGSGTWAATSSSTPPAEAPTTNASTPPGSSTATATPALSASRLAVAGTIATGLKAPWGLAMLPDGTALVTERDTAQVVRVRSGAAPETLTTVPGVVPRGEGGLLGIAVPPGKQPTYALVYYTAADDNRIARMSWDGNRLGSPKVILTGIPKGQIHNGGRLIFGPDGYVYVGTGETGDRDRAQDPKDLAGKILRITSNGRPAPDNPDPNSAVFSLGHRNVQGLAFDAQGRLWASEFGASDVDELNLIAPGGNYGWPQCEGGCNQDGFIDPAASWSPTAIASPSGLAIARGSAWVASLRGSRVWQVPLTGTTAGTPREWLQDEYGRLRTIEPAPDGSLWLVTSNTDGRGNVRDGDDRILRLTLD